MKINYKSIRRILKTKSGNSCFVNSKRILIVTDGWATSGQDLRCKNNNYYTSLLYTQSVGPTFFIHMTWMIEYKYLHYNK